MPPQEDKGEAAWLRTFRQRAADRGVVLGEPGELAQVGRTEEGRTRGTARMRRPSGQEPPLYRVACPCAWMGNRQRPSSRKCPWCGRDGKQIRALWQVGRASDSVVHILHFQWPQGVIRDPEDRDWLVWPDGRRIRFQADHYSGSSTDLTRRLAEHLSGRGAKLVAAALDLGADVRVARVWHVPLAFEQRLRRPKPTLSPQSTNGQRFGSIQLRPLCPDSSCAGEKAWGRLPEAKIQSYYREQRQLNAEQREERREWEAYCAQLQADGVWDPFTTWDEAFPDLAYGPRTPEVVDGPATSGNGQHAIDDPGHAQSRVLEVSGPDSEGPSLLEPAIDPVPSMPEPDQEIDHEIDL